MRQESHTASATWSGCSWRFYDEEIRKQIPKCQYRKYTISEIINGIIDTGFTLERFDEYPAWEDEKVPGEFVAIGRKR